MATATRTLRGAQPLARPVKSEPNVLRRIFIHRADYLYVFPALAAMGLVIIYPLIKMVWMSFQYTSPYGGAVSFVGLDNYRDAVTDEHFGLVVKNTLVWTVACTGLSLILGMLAALVVSRPIRFRGFIRGVLIIPWIISPVTAAFVWKWMYNADFGIISGILIRFHLIAHPIKFIDSTNLVLPSIIVANVWKELPFAMIMIIAGLQTIPEQLYNAAKIDGAGRWRRFTDVTLPQLSPVLLVTSLLLVFANMNSFTFVWVLTGGGPVFRSSIFVTQLYALAFVGSPRFELAAAMGVILFLVLMVFAMFYVWVFTRQGRARHAIEDEAEGGLALTGATVGNIE